MGVPVSFTPTAIQIAAIMTKVQRSGVRMEPMSIARSATGTTTLSPITTRNCRGELPQHWMWPQAQSEHTAQRSAVPGDRADLQFSKTLRRASYSS